MKLLWLTLTLTLHGAFAQQLHFDVASVKPVNEQQFADAMRSGQRQPPRVIVDKGRAEFYYQNLNALIQYAYGVLPIQVTGPEFLKTARFDIVAKLPSGTTDEQAPQMMQALLAERFGLKVHREKKETQIYALVVGKNGVNPKKMKPATAEEIAPEPMPGDMTQTTPFGKMTRREVPGKGMVGFIPGMGTLKVSAAGGSETIEMSNLTTARFAQLLAADGGQPIIDKTNLKGSWEASFSISMEAPPPPPPSGGGANVASAPNAPPFNPMFQAVEQMGLKLEQQKDQVEMLIVDHVEKTATDN